MIKPDLIEHVIHPLVPAEFAEDNYDVWVNPTGTFELGAVSDAREARKKFGTDRPDLLATPNFSTSRTTREDYFGLGAANSSPMKI